HRQRAPRGQARAAPATLSAAGAAAAYGARMGARGNSGVILSQVVRGLKEAFAARERAGAAEVRRAIGLGRRYAYEAVSAPAPGTMLTLIVALDESAGRDGDDVVELL